MSARTFPQRLSAWRAPGITGAVFCAALAFLTASCDKKGGTPDWDTPGGSTPAAETVKSAAPSAQDPSATPAEPASPPAESAPATPAPVDPTRQGLRFIAYNVENWLTMDRYVNNKQLKDSPKPDDEKRTVVDILARHQPDVVGICEIGETKDLQEIQSSLKAAGLDLPHSHYSGGSDPQRHLGLLSRFPIVSTAKPAKMEYQLNGQTFGFNRGVLDATVEARGETYRFLGVHLKSKRDVEEGDQEEMRINEAHLLRAHVDAILDAEPEARLVVYGDFNDTYPSKAVRAVTGGGDEARRLMPIYMKDSRHEAWTHHWSNQDVYSRIDFITVSRALRKEVDFRASRIIDDADWYKASDHRPVMAVFK